MGLRDEKNFRRHYQQSPVALGLVEMTIPDKPRSHLQHYRFTEAEQRLCIELHGHKPQ